MQRKGIASFTFIIIIIMVMIIIIIICCIPSHFYTFHWFSLPV